ncbi:MAG: helix-turn-helix transcriptional regulator [Chloroflexi bacterium]|nr:helix-turn-helix transcriptional regulator [Chloroflexota bacterium]
MLDLTQAKPFTPAPELVISDLETLKVLADPLRLSILEYLMRPSTVKRIAEKINKPATKLYYHFNLLEKHGLIVLVDTRIVSGIIEKHYQAAARVYRVAKNLLAPGSDEFDEGLELTLTGVFTSTKQEILANIHDATIDMTEEAPWHRRMTLNNYRFELTPKQYEKLHNALKGLLNEYNDLSQDNQDRGTQTASLKMLMVSYPIVTDDVDGAAENEEQDEQS